MEQVNYMEVAAGAFAALFALSEAFAQIPSIRANSVFQAIQNVLKKMAPKKDESKP